MAKAPEHKLVLNAGGNRKLEFYLVDENYPNCAKIEVCDSFALIKIYYIYPVDSWHQENKEKAFEVKPRNYGKSYTAKKGKGERKRASSQFRKGFKLK